MHFKASFDKFKTPDKQISTSKPSKTPSSIPGSKRHPQNSSSPWRNLNSPERNKRPLSHYLSNYEAKFSTCIDLMWNQFDFNQNGYLERDEARKFIDELSKVIQKDRAQFYKRDQFNSLFDQIDEDRNGVLSKGEFAQFIKLNFKKRDSLDY